MQDPLRAVFVVHTPPSPEHLGTGPFLRPKKEPEVSEIFQNSTYFCFFPPETTVAALHCQNWNKESRYVSGVKTLP